MWRVFGCRPVGLRWRRACWIRVLPMSFGHLDRKRLTGEHGCVPLIAGCAVA
jgi:hypothetical protein